MRSRGKHLLEAFKVAGPSTSAPSSAAPLAPSSAAGVGGGAGGPFGAAAGAKPFGATPSIARPGSNLGVSNPGASGATRASPRGAIVLNSAQTRLISLVVLLLVVVAFLLGRMSVTRSSDAGGDPVYAASSGELRSETGSTPTQVPPRSDPTQPPASNPAPSRDANSAAPTVDPNPRTPAEQALLDKSNVYTIKLVHYSNTEVHQRLAADTARYVIGTHNLPAVVAADSTGLYILIGAAPRQVDLDDYLARIKKMPGPPPLSRAGEFHDAYIEKIDKVFRRDK